MSAPVRSMWWMKLLTRSSVWQDGSGRITEADHKSQTAAILSAVEETACSRCEKRKDCWEDDFFAVSQEVLALAEGEKKVYRCIYCEEKFNGNWG